jgi:hypothetical protein
MNLNAQSIQYQMINFFKKLIKKDEKKHVNSV